jgi:hypothetical protein
MKINKYLVKYYLSCDKKIKTKYIIKEKNKQNVIIYNCIYNCIMGIYYYI